MKKIKKPKWKLTIWRLVKFTLKPRFYKGKLLWKDKFETPRCEKVPTIEIEWFWWHFYWYQGGDTFWEQWLWVTKYCDNDIDKAEKTWGWYDMTTKKSTWKSFDILRN